MKKKGNRGNREKNYAIGVDGVSQVALFRGNGKRKPQINPHHVYLPRKRRKSLASKKLSITYDSGREFSEHRMIEFETKMTVFFTHPYHSWERGTNENANCLLRQFVPKKTDSKDAIEEKLQYCTELINHRFRERLGWLTLYGTFHELSTSSKSYIGL